MSYTLPGMPPTTVDILNPRDASGMIYVKAIDGALKGRSVWIDRFQSTYVCQHSRGLKRLRNARYASSGYINAHLTVKEITYHVKHHLWSRYSGVIRVETCLYYLTTESGDSFDDVKRLFLPKMT